MIRLADDLAAVRRLYRRPLATLPDILVIEIAPAYRAPSLSLGRYYGIMVESGAERDELDAFLRRARPAPVVPDLLDHRPSAIVSDRITIATYAPTERGWPWLLLCHWPRAYLAQAPAGAGLFARGVYTIEMVEGEAASAACAACAEALLLSLGRDRAIALTMVAHTGEVLGQA